MDPPSFTRKMLMIEMQDCGQKITESEAKRFQQVLKDKAEIINAKLEKSSSKIDDPDEMGLIKTEQADENGLIIQEQTYKLQDQFDSHDLDQAIVLLDIHENQLIKFDDMPVVKEEDIKKMILSADERNFKERVWINLNKQWIVEQNNKKRQKKDEQKKKRALKATSSFASSSQLESEPQSPTSKFSSPEPLILCKREISQTVSELKESTFLQIPAKKRNIKAETPADALKQRYPEIKGNILDELFGSTAQSSSTAADNKTYKPNF